MARSTLTTLLYEKADVSTFLHESAHFYLHLYGEIAAQDDAPDTIKQDMQTFLDWVGVKDLATWRSLSLNTQRRHHEAFAYNFELWLATGKAPSVALEGIFQRFRRWLLDLYKSIRGKLNAIFRDQFGEDLPILTGEVRQVMERMLASDEQIAQAAAVRGAVPMFQSQHEAGMDDATWTAHQQALDNARETAIADVTKATLREMRWLTGARSKVLRELQRETRALREEMRAEVATEVAARPVYRALQWLRTGVLVDEDGVPVPGEREVNHRLRTAEVEAVAGADAAKLRSVTSKGGVLPDMVAEQFGFSSGEALVRALLAAPPLDEAIEARTDERMLQEHGELVDPKQRQRVIDEALHNEARARFVAVELRHVSRATEPVRLMLAAAKQAAQQILSRQTLNDLAPKKWTPRSASRGAERTMVRWASPAGSTAGISRSRL